MIQFLTAFIIYMLGVMAYANALYYMQKKVGIKILRIDFYLIILKALFISWMGFLYEIIALIIIKICRKKGNAFDEIERR